MCCHVHGTSWLQILLILVVSHCIYSIYTPQLGLWCVDAIETSASLVNDNYLKSTVFILIKRKRNLIKRKRKKYESRLRSIRVIKIAKQ